jgi:hypothetical protein
MSDLTSEVMDLNGCSDTLLGFVASSFETHRFAMLLRMRSEILVVRSRAAASRTMRPSMLPRMDQTEKNA